VRISSRQAGARCEKPRIERDGEKLERPMSSSGLWRADDDDDARKCIKTRMSQGLVAMQDNNKCTATGMSDQSLTSLSKKNEFTKTTLT
jgi:hypothetical protein